MQHDTATTEDLVEGAFRAHAGRLYGYVVSILRRGADAEDVLQTVFADLLRSGERIRGVNDLRAYLYRCARNEALRFLRSRREEPRDDLEALGHLVTSPQGRADEARDLSLALAVLPDEQREVLLLKLYHDMTFREIAELAGVPLQTAASRYRYGLDRLRDILRGEEATNRDR